MLQKLMMLNFMKKLRDLNKTSFIKWPLLENQMWERQA